MESIIGDNGALVYGRGSDICARILSWYNGCWALYLIASRYDDKYETTGKPSPVVLFLFILRVITDEGYMSSKTVKLTLKESELTQELLKECFDYHEDGYLIWKERPLKHFKDVGNQKRFNTPFAGKVAGYYNKRTDSKRDDFGYYKVRITLEKSQGMFKLHRLIFLWHNGYLPEVLDHKDGNTMNNRIDNLRESTVQQNSCNLKLNVNNTSGYKGVVKDRCCGKWRASIKSEDNFYYLGAYTSKEEAAYAYNLAASVLHKEFAYLNKIDIDIPNFKFTNKILMNCTKTL